MADEPDNLVLEHLRALRDDMTAMRADIGFLKKEATGHTSVLNILVQDVRLIRAAADDAAALRVTSGEIAAMHHDINRAMLTIATLEARVEALETK